MCAHRSNIKGLNCPLCSIPLLHTWDGGKTFNSGGFGREDAEWLHQLSFQVHGRILETGAGLSTLIFLMSGQKVISVSTDMPVAQRISDFISKSLEAQGNWEFINGNSGRLLPRLTEKFSFALIDGGHGFPVPFVDFFYMNSLLDENAILVVDDAQLYAPRELILNLAASDNFFEIVSVSPSGKAYAFKKITGAEYLPDFGGLVRDREKLISADINSFLYELRNSLTNGL